MSTTPSNPVQSCQPKGVEALAHYVEMRTKQPLLNLGACVHSIHLGTEFAAEITFYDLAHAVNSHATLTARIAELEANERAYEAKLGERTYNEIAAQLVDDANRIEELEKALLEARRSIVGIAADCHRTKWQFDLSEDYKPTARVARDLILKAFNEIHRIGDVAIKAYKSRAVLEPKGTAV